MGLAHPTDGLQFKLRNPSAGWRQPLGWGAAALFLAGLGGFSVLQVKHPDPVVQGVVFGCLLSAVVALFMALSSLADHLGGRPGLDLELTATQLHYCAAGLVGDTFCHTAGTRWERTDVTWPRTGVESIRLAHLSRGLDVIGRTREGEPARLKIAPDLDQTESKTLLAQLHEAWPETARDRSETSPDWSDD